jgi:two-component system response regulator NreC
MAPHRPDPPSPAHANAFRQPSEASILVVAEHSLVRAGLRAVLGSAAGLFVVGEAPDLEVATGIAARVRPDVVLLDSPLGAALAPDVLLRLRRAVPEACLLCLARETPHRIDGVHCVPPESDVTELRSTLGTILRDRCAACLLRVHCPAPQIAVALSRRERQVAVRVARGMSSKQIAAALGIGLRTVNTYRESLARKLGASSPAVVTRYVLEHGLHALAEECIP